MTDQQTKATREAAVREHLAHSLVGCNEPAPDRRGKVRDLYVRGDELWMVVTDRVSAFDVVLGTIPLKGAFLSEQAAFWLERAADILPTHFIERPDPQVLRCRKAAPLPIELVVRGHLAGSLMREPAETRGSAYGLSLPPDLKPFQAFDAPIVTPTTKAAVGEHDEPISLEGIVEQGLVQAKLLEQATEAALALFDLGKRHAEAQGLILVDTKYEMGLIDGELVLIDELHTADSSRFWERDDWVSAMAAGGYAEGQTPRMLDKERLRRWLLEQGFSGHGEPPALPDDVCVDLALHYWELTERVLGQPFQAPSEAAPARVARVLSA